MGVFIGSEALAAGQVTRSELRRHHRRLFPDVYGPDNPTLLDRARAAWLWSGRRGVIAGVAASGLLGARWVPEDSAIEMLWRNTHPPTGVIVRNETYARDEITTFGGVPVTTRARTLFDLGRHLRRDDAVARMDALLWTWRVTVDDVAPLIARYPACRGIRPLRTALALADGGADSPRETWLRLLLTDAGMAPEDTQIEVFAGTRMVAKVDMGWRSLKIAVQYDGRHHQTERGQYVRDRRIQHELQALGWIVLRVIAEDSADEIIARVAAALARRRQRAA